MRKIQEQAGFTLVELAIVLTIVGLLIGGILKGQQLMQNSRVTATIAQVNGFEAATTNFRDVYGELPGDLTDADKRIANCGAICSTAGATTAGDGKVGMVDWDPSAVYQSQPAQGTPPSFTAITTPAVAAATVGETVLFWYELQQVGLISAVSSEGISGGTTAVTASFGGTVPAAKIGGGWVVGNISGRDASGASISAALGRPTSLPALGTVLVMVNDPTAVINITANKQALTPAIAAQMDRKIDDGVPDTGQVHAYGVTASCYAGTASPYTYAEGTITKDCGLILRIQR